MQPEEIGSYLKSLRLQHNLTQKELASKLHITHQAVSNWEKGKSLPDISILSQLGDVYGVSIDNLLLKENGQEEPKKAPMILRRIMVFLGLVMSLNFMAAFLFYNYHIVTSVVNVFLFLILSLLYSFLIRHRKPWIEYLIITAVFIIISLITIPGNFRFYMLDTTDYMKLDEQVDIIYPREFDEMTQAVKYQYIFDQFAIIFTEAEEDIDFFNLSKFYEGGYETIETPGMPIQDLLVVNERIFVTTFDASLPGEFKLYELDFETKEFTLLYESQDVLRMYHAFQQLYFISDPHLEPQTKIYQYDLQTEDMSPPITVDFTVYGMTEYFAEYEDDGGTHMETYFIMSVTNVPSGNGNNVIGLFNYDFELEHTLYEEQDAVRHLLFHDYGHVLIGTEDGAILFQDLDYIRLGEAYARWPKVVSPEMIRVNESLYQEDFQTEEFHLYSEGLFYDDEYYIQGARFLLSDENNDLFAIDNELFGVVRPVGREIEEPRLPSGTRLTLYIIGGLTYGGFLVLGHKPRK